MCRGEQVFFCVLAWITLGVLGLGGFLSLGFVALYVDGQKAHNEPALVDDIHHLVRTAMETIFYCGLVWVVSLIYISIRLLGWNPFGPRPTTQPPPAP